MLLVGIFDLPSCSSARTELVQQDTKEKVTMRGVRLAHVTEKGRLPQQTASKGAELFASKLTSPNE